eukprot:GFUD01067227.1.p1 GENE.GFUD01067227.1~~GFUD01067227.1.p1  ORF type:complete len:114 (+),score=31.51 GFUD01067227.1:2-343(+)
MCYLAMPGNNSLAWRHFEEGRASEGLFSIGWLFDTIRSGNMNIETFDLLTLLQTNEKALETSTVDVYRDSSDENSQDENQNIEERYFEEASDEEIDEEEFITLMRKALITASD